MHRQVRRLVEALQPVILVMPALDGEGLHALLVDDEPYVVAAFVLLPLANSWLTLRLPPAPVSAA